MLFLEDKLYCPGPTPISNNSKISNFEGDLYHRSTKFSFLLSESRKMLSRYFGSSSKPIIFTSSGTGAMEAVVSNFTNKDDVFVLNGGKFGQRWSEICKAYFCNVTEYNFEYGSAPLLEKISEFIKLNKFKFCFFQSHETSTGTLYPVKEIAKTIKKIDKNIIIVVDAISSLVAHPFEMDNWDIDIAIGSSHKGFSIPPGLSFIALSNKMLNEKLEYGNKFYFDILKEKNSQDNGTTTWTCATSLVQSLYSNLINMQNTELKEYFNYYKILAKGVRESLRAINLKLFSNDFNSNALSIFKLPDEVNWSDLNNILINRYKMIFSNGQGILKNKVIRFSHFGMISPFYIIDGVSSLELALYRSGYKKFEIGDGVKTLINVFYLNGI